MSNGWKWELGKWGDDRPHLYFEDNLRGHDFNVVLVDGKAYIEEYTNPDDPEDMTTRRTEINLPEFLASWLERQDKEYNE